VLFEQIDTIAWYLAPTVVKGIAADIEATRVNIADDPTWMNVGKKDDKAKDRFHLWAVTNRRATCYSVFDSRSRKAAKTFLGKLSGVLVSDGAACFKVLASEYLTLANDWFHVRRKFIAAETSYGKDATFFIDRIREMAKIEAEIKGRPPDEIRVARQTFVRPIVEVIRAQLDALIVLPKSSIGRAITYTKKLWTGLTVFLDNPDVPMHSNDVERAMYGPAVGRKNHYGSRNLTTAQVAAVWYSVVETCKLCGIDPRAYLVATLTAIPTKKPYKMPWDWRDDTASMLLN
jgi:transposase